MPKYIRSVNWKGFRLIRAKDKPRSEQTIRLPYKDDMLAFSKIKKTNLKKLIGNIILKSFWSNNAIVFCFLISMWRKLQRANGTVDTAFDPYHLNSLYDIFIQSKQNYLNYIWMWKISNHRTLTSWYIIKNMTF